MDNYEKYVGQIFDNRYRIERVIGIGGMAIVFKATDLLMRRVVAVKILKELRHRVLGHNDKDVPTPEQRLLMR